MCRVAQRLSRDCFFRPLPICGVLELQVKAKEKEIRILMVYAPSAPEHVVSVLSSCCTLSLAIHAPLQGAR